MSRRHRAEKRQAAPDIRYKSPLVAHLVNVIMQDGKKNLAQRIVYGAFEKVSEFSELRFDSPQHFPHMAGLLLNGKRTKSHLQGI